MSKEVLLFGADNFVLAAPMAQRLEGVHVGFLRQATKLKAKILKDGSWYKVVEDKVLQGEGKKRSRPTWTGGRQQ